MTVFKTLQNGHKEMNKHLFFTFILIGDFL